MSDTECFTHDWVRVHRVDDPLFLDRYVCRSCGVAKEFGLIFKVSAPKDDYYKRCLESRERQLTEARATIKRQSGELQRVYELVSHWAGRAQKAEAGLGRLSPKEQL